MSNAVAVESRSWPREFLATLALAWPLVVAQLAQNSLVATDVIMMGWLGPEFLAAGTLASSFYTPLMLLGGGVASAVAPLAAQALGARDFRMVRRTVRQGFWAAIVVATALMPLVWNIRSILLALGQDAHLAELAESYMRIAGFSLYPALGIFVLRSFLSALGTTGVILWSTVIGVVVNAVGAYGLMFGNFGLPALGLQGAGIVMVASNSLIFLILLGYALMHRRARRFHILVRFWRPDWSRLGEIFRVGAPIGLTIMAEVGMFSMTTLFMGWLGTAEVAAHAVALQLSSLAFMVPLGIGMAATVRVGRAHGAGNRDAVGKAGWSAYAVGVGFMACSCIVFLLFRPLLVGVFLDPADPANLHSFQLAVSYLMIAALFQLADGAQAVSAHSLRGMSDTRTPMLIAFLGYWAVGMPSSYLLGFTLGLEGLGIWIGLAIGLVFVAITLTARFAMRERLGLTGPKAATAPPLPMHS